MYAVAAFGWKKRSCKGASTVWAQTIYELQRCGCSATAQSAVIKQSNAISMLQTELVRQQATAYESGRQWQLAISKPLETIAHQSSATALRRQAVDSG